MVDVVESDVAVSWMSGVDSDWDDMVEEARE